MYVWKSKLQTGNSEHGKFENMLAKFECRGSFKPLRSMISGQSCWNRLLDREVNEFMALAIVNTKAIAN